MKSTVEELEDNKVRLHVEVGEDEFEEAVNAAFKRIAREVRLPGFRPGKAPRKILEARLGKGVGREEALRASLPDYYSLAVEENEVDVVAAPEIDITSGEESGPVEFDAVVEIRPEINVGGYQGLRVEIPSPILTDAELDERIDALRRQHATLAAVARPAVDDDHVTIDIHCSHDGDEVPGLTATDYDYRVGSAAVVAEIDEQLRGSKPGDILEFAAAHPDPDEVDDLEFRILVKEVTEPILPDLDDEFVSMATEFETVDELRDDTTRRFGNLKRSQAQAVLNSKTAEALAALVEDEISEALVNNEMGNRIQDMATRLKAQGADLGQYLDAIGKSQEEFSAELRDDATQSVKVDLALRAVAAAEDLEADEDDLQAQIEGLATQLGQDADLVRAQLDAAGQISSMRIDLRKQKAIDWLIDHVEIVDTDGRSISRDDLELAPDPDEGDPDEREPGEADPERSDGTTGATGTLASERDDADEGDQ